MECRDWIVNHLITMDNQDQLFFNYVLDVPLLTKNYAYMCGIINLVVPGLGTIVGACICQTETVSKTQTIIGVCQFYTATMIIGYIWSIYWAYLMVTKAHAQDYIMYYSQQQSLEKIDRESRGERTGSFTQR